MRSVLFALALGGALLPAAALAEPPSAADRTALETLAASNDAAWNASDAAAISAQYSEEGNLRLTGMAEAVAGRAALRAYFERSFAARPSGLRHLTRLQRLEMLGPDLAFADAHVRLEWFHDGRWELAREFVNHSVIRREAGVWRLHSVRAHRLP